MQGGVAQGIGWALNECIFDRNGVMEKQGSGLPDASRVGSADDRHRDRRSGEPASSYGVRGVGEVPIVPPLATVPTPCATRPASVHGSSLSPSRVLDSIARSIDMPTVHLPNDLLGFTGGLDTVAIDASLLELKQSLGKRSRGLAERLDQAWLSPSTADLQRRRLPVRSASRRNSFHSPRLSAAEFSVGAAFFRSVLHDGAMAA